MTRKDAFLRAIQSEPFRRNFDLPLAFGLALNLAEEHVPPDVPKAAKDFANGIACSEGRVASPRGPSHQPV